jgi:hypothetical protein
LIGAPAPWPWPLLPRSSQHRRLAAPPRRCRLGPGALSFGAILRGNSHRNVVTFLELFSFAFNWIGRAHAEKTGARTANRNPQLPTATANPARGVRAPCRDRPRRCLARADKQGQHRRRRRQRSVEEDKANEKNGCCCNESNVVSRSMPRLGLQYAAEGGGASAAAVLWTRRHAAQFAGLHDAEDDVPPSSTATHRVLPEANKPGGKRTRTSSSRRRRSVRTDHAGP